MRPRMIRHQARLVGPALLALLPLFLGAALARAETVRDQLWVTDGDVRAVAYTNNTIYLGGNFQHVGPAIGGMAVFDQTSGAAFTPYFGVAGTVDAIITDGLGGYYVGGLFSGAHGQARSNLLHFDGAGNVTAWNPAPDGEVFSLSLSGSTLYVGGSFSHIAGQPRNNLAAIDTSGTLSSWAPNPTDKVKVVHVALGSLYVGGYFHSIATQTRHLAAAFDITTGALRAWNPTAQTDQGYSVEAIAPFNDTIYLGGTFYFIGGQFRDGIAAVDSTNGGLLTWNPTNTIAGRIVYTIGISQMITTPFTRTVWIGGSFSTMGGATRANIAAVDGSTAAATSWNPGTNGPVHSMALKTGFQFGTVGTVFAAGDFTQAGGLNRPYLCSISSAGAVSGWSPLTTGRVNVAFLGGGGLVTGGAFYSAGMTIRANIAALDATSGQVTPWNLGATGPVDALLVHNNSLYVGGSFNELGVSVRFGAAEVDLTNGNVTPWDPDLGCVDFNCTGPTVYAIARPSHSNVVCLGGDFEQATGQNRRNLALCDATSGAPTAFTANVNFPVHSVAVSERNVLPFDMLTVFAGGAFNVVNAGVNGHDANGVIRYSLASFDPSTGAVTSWAPAPNLAHDVDAMTLIHPGLNPGTLWVAGTFPSMGGATRNNVAAVDAGTGVATSWDPNTNGIVRTMLLRSGGIVLGGDFTTVGGVGRNHIAMVDGSAGAVMSWNPDAADTVKALDTYGGTVFAGGSFSRVSNYPHAFFAGISDGTVTAVESEPAPEHPIAIHAAPNPFGDHTGLRFEMSRSGMARVDVYDPAGRLVKQLHSGFLYAGEHVITWSGQDEAGRVVASGVYFMRVLAPSLEQTAKVFRLR